MATVEAGVVDLLCGQCAGGLWRRQRLLGVSGSRQRRRPDDQHHRRGAGRTATGRHRRAKAVILNVVATGAALGLTVVVFQFGHGAAALGFHPVGTLQAYLPVALFALLFGLSMDYEVFLIRRIQEEWLRSQDNAGAVATAITHTGRQITAAAASMVAVFGSFEVADVLELKQFGLAIAVPLDATAIRSLLVPAIMSLASRGNWWLPGTLARRLPRCGWSDPITVVRWR